MGGTILLLITGAGYYEDWVVPLGYEIDGGSNGCL